MITEALKQRLSQLPLGPGIYLMKDAAGDILYIGKAVSLKKRVQSYFLDSRLHGPKIKVMVTKIADIDYIETRTEVDALLLEASLINEYKPPYNTRQKDDKSFPLIKITEEDFPLVTMTRSRTDKRAVYYGPYTDSFLLREALKIIYAIFPIRKCRTLPKAPCLYYHLKQCLAPCIRPEVKEEYARLVTDIRSFLGGGKRSFIDYLSERMEEASREYRYEEAKVYKDQIEALSRLRKKRFYDPVPAAGVGLAATQELKRALALDRLPEKIACIDISNIQGRFSVGSKVSFYRELPDKNEYRKYRVRTVEGANDFASIGEVVGRMLRGIREGRETFVPDLLMIDGGKGQLASARAELEREGFGEMSLVSIAKRFEHLYTPGSAEPVVLSKDSPALRLLQKIRDEAHRFAISYYRRLHEKSMSRSFLDDIPGLGEKRKRMLRERFSTAEELVKASVEELSALPGMDRRSASRVLMYLLGK